MTHARPDTIQAGSRLAELGVDSLTKVELIGELEVRLNFRVDETAVSALIRVQDLIDLVQSERPPTGRAVTAKGA